MTEPKNSKSFTDLYISVRKKESRVLTDSQVALLPKISNNNPHYSEWQVRKKSANKFSYYLSQRKNTKTIMDLGCGNGWFSHFIAKSFPTIMVTGLDINEFELKQANKVFQRENLKFVFGDIFKLESNDFKEKFDLVVLNASVQYFPDFIKLMSKIETFLKLDGEIHIIDSPFYVEKNISFAKQRTLDYYKKLGFPEMSEYYFHHGLGNLKKFEILYHPKKSFISKIFKQQDSPFSWYRRRLI